MEYFSFYSPYQDEEEDMFWGEAQLDLIECIGKQNWLLQQL